VRPAERVRSRPSALRRGVGRDATTDRLALGLVLATMTAQVLFLAVGCDWDLCGDEAEYWAWSRRLDWSYFAKGPLIAWIIRLGTELAGGLSLRWAGSLMPAVRLPAVLLGGLTAWGVYRLGGLASGRPRVGLIAMLLLPAVPLFAIGALLMTIDTPLVCFWAWAAVWAYRTIVQGDQKGWIIAGTVGALGVLAKYTMLAFPASVGLFLLVSPGHRRLLLRPGFWTMSLVCVGLGMAPIVIWNAQHDWVAAGQMADRMGLTPASSPGRLLPVLAFLGGEAAALGGIWWFLAIRAIVRAGRQVARREFGDGLRFLLCLWGVIWTACLMASVLGENELNWMAPGYVAVLVLIGWVLDRDLSAVRWGRWTKFIIAAWAVNVLAMAALAHTEWLYPALARWIPASTDRRPAPLRQIDPTCRMRGNARLAEAVEDQLASLRAGGEDPFVLTPTYTLASTLAFYLPGQPETYCLTWTYGMTRRAANQHDLWHPNPRHDAEAFRNRPAVVVEDANLPPNFAHAMERTKVFGHAGETTRVVVRERGVVVGAWDVTVCRDYRGVEGYVQNTWLPPDADPMLKRYIQRDAPWLLTEGQGSSASSPRPSPPKTGAREKEGPRPPVPSPRLRGEG
jgi:hypothetical protein